ncbi:MAG: DUF5110 domain-containing protein [Phycisphaerae bacterium]|nr:DUF5110 domain-containing protein [Phycisphaerae bacterium]
MRRLAGFIVLVLLANITIAGTNPSIKAMPTLQFKEVANGVWSAKFGDVKDKGYLEYAANAPQLDSLAKLSKQSFPLDAAEIRGIVSNDRSVIRVPLTPTEKLYGFGLQFQGMNRRGGIYHLRVDHYSTGTSRLHAPVPFYISSEGYGVFFNCPKFMSVYAGVGNRHDSVNFPEPKDRNAGRGWSAQPISDAVEASSYADGMEVIVFAGPTMLEVIQRYNLYCGGGCLPPKWGLGFWHRMPTLASDESVLKDVEDFKTKNFPLEVIGLEPGWHSKSYPCTFSWDKSRFPDPAGFHEKLTEKGLHTNLWLNPYLSSESPMYKDMLPYCGSHTVWLGVVPDYTIEAAQKILTAQHEKEHISVGVSGYKIDEIDGYDNWLWPDHAIFPSGNSAEYMRQTYGLQCQKLYYDMFRKNNQRTFSQVRGSNAGASAYPFAIYTDHYDHKGFVGAMANASLAGVIYTPEIRSAGSAEEWLKRMQTVCFSPMVQLNGWASKTKPWSFDSVTDEVRDVIQLRMQMMPYFYNAYADYQRKGIPPVRAMVLQPGYLDNQQIINGTLDGEKNPYAMAIKKDVVDQYMFGDCLLVAPLFTGQKSRQVILPEGKWYDFYTGKLVGESEIVTVAPPIEQIPLFVKDGGIIPMFAKPVNNITTMTGDIELEIRHYGKKPSMLELYDDDGQTFNYQKDQYAIIKLQAEFIAGQFQGTEKIIKDTYKTKYNKFTWNFMTK